MAELEVAAYQEYDNTHSRVLSYCDFFSIHHGLPKVLAGARRVTNFSSFQKR
jgi:hypothetical protein